MNNNSLKLRKVEKKIFSLEIKIFFSNLLDDNCSLKFNFFVLEKNFFLNLFREFEKSIEKLKKNLEIKKFFRIIHVIIVIIVVAKKNLT